LNGQQAFKDWLSKEADCSIRMNQEAYYPGINLGFFGDNTRAGLAHRSIYSEFFFFERVQRSIEPMAKILDTKINSYVKANCISKTDYVEVDVRDFLERIAIEWISNMTFGCSHESEMEVDLDSPGWKELRNYKWDKCDFADYKKISLTKIGNLIIETGLTSSKEVKNLL
jgi:hypothetical protein